jgi:hypothetical protein
MKIYVAYEDYDYGDNKCRVIANWASSRRMYEIRQEIFTKMNTKVEEVEMTYEEYEDHDAKYSDTKITLQKVRMNNGEVIELPLTYIELMGIDDWFEEEIMRYSYAYMPCDIFADEYAEALRALGMDSLYATILSSDHLDVFNDSAFAVANNIMIYPDDTWYDVVEPNEFMIILMRNAELVKSSIFKKIRKAKEEQKKNKRKKVIDDVEK